MEFILSKSKCKLYYHTGWNKQFFKFKHIGMVFAHFTNNKKDRRKILGENCK